MKLFLALAALLLLHILAAALPTDPLAEEGFQGPLNANELEADTIDSHSDPVRGIRFIYPTDGAIEMSPVVFRVQIHVRPGGEKLFSAQYANASFCVDVNAVTIFCSKLGEPSLEYNYVGECTARVYLKRPGSYEDEVKSVSDPISFTLVNATELIARAIRETWASQSVLPQGVKVVFIGCRPHAVASPSLEETKLRRIWESIELEKQVYADLLTDELDRDDAYVRLADKTKEFLHLVAMRYSNAQYAMVAGDDTMYLRLDKIVGLLQKLGPQERFYAGYVREIENARKTPPTRNPKSPHYLTKEQYPMSELPPFALGANFFLSMDALCRKIAAGFGIWEGWTISPSPSGCWRDKYIRCISQVFSI